MEKPYSETEATDTVGPLPSSKRNTMEFDTRESSMLEIFHNNFSGIPSQQRPIDSSTKYPDGEQLQEFNTLPPFTYDPDDPFRDEDGIKRTGSVFITCAHVITAVIGAGVLSLPYAMASLGWLLGPICFVLFAAITLYTAQLLADLYIIDGKRQRTYTDMVCFVYGNAGRFFVGLVQQTNLILTALAYTITSAQSMKALATSYCDAHGITEGCFNNGTILGIIFGAVQIFLSQIPSLEHFWWASIIGALMSFGYSIIGFALTLAYQNHSLTNGTIEPMQLDNTADTVWNILNSLGNVLFAYSFSFILLEIQDTMRTPKGNAHGPVKGMKLAVNISVSIMTCFYIAIAASGYASLGNTVQGSILQSYPQAPAWVIDMANAMVLVHMVPAYQVWSQPHFEFVDLSVERSKNWPKFLGRGWVFRLWYRTLYVCLLTFLAVLLPFFNVVLGFVGAVGFWPATVFFPIHCWIKVYQPPKKMRIFLYTLDVFCLLVTLAAIAGSIEAIVASASSVELFSA